MYILEFMLKLFLLKESKHSEAQEGRKNERMERKGGKEIGKENRKLIKIIFMHIKHNAVAISPCRLKQNVFGEQIHEDGVTQRLSQTENELTRLARRFRVAPKKQKIKLANSTWLGPQQPCLCCQEH